MSAIANADGVVFGNFNIPPGVKTGRQNVFFQGSKGSVASAYYTATGQSISAETVTDVDVIYAPPAPLKPLTATLITRTIKKGTTCDITFPQIRKCISQNLGKMNIVTCSTPGQGTSTLHTNSTGNSDLFFYRYQPTASFVGVDSFFFTCIDSGSGQTIWVSAIIEVTETIRPPVATGMSLNVAYNTPHAFSLAGLYSSADATSVALTHLSTPLHGTASITNATAGDVLYTPTTNYSGSDVFVYTVTDSNGRTAAATISIGIVKPALKAHDDNYTLPKESLQGVDVTIGLSKILDVMENDVYDGDVSNVEIYKISNVRLSAGNDDARVALVNVNGIEKALLYVYPATQYDYHATFSVAGSFDYSIRYKNNQTITSTATVTIKTGAGAYWDPLAETFSVPLTAQVFGVSVWVAKKGASDMAIELRDVVYGMPDKTPLARSTKSLSSIVEGDWNNFWFEFPITCIADRNYAFVAMCADDATELAMAEIGKYDLEKSEWVTKQPYMTGVMMTSSNNATWTAHQNSDLKFKVLGKSRSLAQTEKTVTIGTVQLAGATDFMVNANVGIPDASCKIVFRLTMPNGEWFDLAPNTALSLNKGYTGTMTVTATLRGNTEFTPVLFQSVTVSHGVLAPSAQYVSRAMRAGPNSRVRCIYEALLPAGATVVASVVKTIDGVEGNTTATMPVVSTAPLDYAWAEHTCELSAVDADAVAVRLVLSGSASGRPAIKNFRAMVM